MLSITYFRRCWYIHQYRKNRNQIIDIKFHIDSFTQTREGERTTVGCRSVEVFIRTFTYSVAGE